MERLVQTQNNWCQLYERLLRFSDGTTIAFLMWAVNWIACYPVRYGRYGGITSRERPSREPRQRVETTRYGS